MKQTRNKIGQFTKSFFKRMWIYTQRIAVLIIAIGTALAFTQAFYPVEKISYAAPAMLIHNVEAPREIPPVMIRISKCENSGTQLDKNGQVQMHWNKNGTVDVGKYAINTVWFKKATAMGLDLTKEKDNETMAMWIYENKGTGDWSASSNCWNK